MDRFEIIQRVRRIKGVDNFLRQNLYYSWQTKLPGVGAVPPWN